MKRLRLFNQRAWITVLALILPTLVAGLRAGEIHDAVAAGDLNKVRALVAANPASLDSRDELGFTPLHKACFTQQGAVARFLLDQGASVTARDAFRQTPLHRASYGSGHDLALIQRLIDKGADVNAFGTNGTTPLHWAAFKGDVELAKLLFANGADVNAYDKYRGPTTTASISGTVLQVAINQGPREDLAVLLVERGAKLNRKDSVGNTELHLAATKGYAELARRLLGHGADVHAVNQYGRTALYYAARHGYRRVADALIAGGAATGTIVETNYGKAPQLAATLEEGEAYLWYCGGGYAVKTKRHLLLFNPSGVDTSLEAGLANGHLNPNELAGLKITVLISTPQRWPIGPDSLELAKRMPDVDVVASQRSPASGVGGPTISSYRLAVPNESFTIGGILVHTIPALAGGLGYLVEADGVKVFHAGLHLSGNVPSQLADYRKEIDFLRPFGAIDVAILSAHSHSNDIAITYEPYLYLLDHLSPKAVYLQGANIAEQYPRCADVLRARPIPVFYPEGGLAQGERFHFLRDRGSEAQSVEAPAAVRPASGAIAGNQQPPTLDVTYIAHEGFMVRAAGKKVLVDALFSPEFAAMVGPSPDVLKKILEAQEPFDDVDLVLVTHKDSDHFHAASVIALLRSNPRCRLVAHRQVVDVMRPVAGFADVEQQIRVITLESGAREQVSHNGVTVDVLSLQHEHRPEVANLAFVTELGGARFVHMGDAFFAESEALVKSYPFEQAPIDLLFLNQYDRYGRAPGLVAERIKPSHIVAMHLYPAAMDQYPDEFTDDATKVRAVYPGIVVFGRPMERRVFARSNEASSRTAPRIEPPPGPVAIAGRGTPSAAPGRSAKPVGPVGMRLEWTQFVGGSGDEFLGWQGSNPARLGRDGRLWLTGATTSQDFPTTPDALYPTAKTGSGPQTQKDSFLLEFDTSRRNVAYSTFLGGAKGQDSPASVDVGRDGTITIVGSTGSSDFPTTARALTKALEGEAGFLTVLGARGRTLDYSTFVGGQGTDRSGPDWVGQSFVDSSGEITLFGITGSRSVPSTDAVRPNGLQRTRAFALYVMRLDATGQRVLFSRLLANAWGTDVQRLDSGDFLVVGTTTNRDFPATEGAIGRTFHGGGGIAGGDIFIMRLSSDLQTVSFATLFGGSGEELWPKVVSLPSGDFFVFGKTTSSDLPVTAGAVERAMEGTEALFLARFSGDGRTLEYCTYLGGRGADTSSYVGSLVYDGHARVYLSGNTSSSRFPVTSDAFQPNHHGGRDAFLLAFNVTDNTLAYGSYLGGSKNDGAYLALDQNGAVYVIGTTDSDDFPTSEGSSRPRQRRDLFISKFSVRDNPTSLRKDSPK